jgi:hypothetical protein
MLTTIGCVRANEDSMAKKKVAEVDLTEKLRHLQELIAALDRRVPRVERVGEVSIAREAAALRDKALQRIAALEARRKDAADS